MAGVVLHHRKAVGLDVVLNSTGEIHQGAAGLHGGQALHQGLLSNARQVLGLLGGTLAHQQTDAAIAVVAVEIGTGVDLDEVTGLDHPLVAGDAVDDLVIN